MSRKHWSEWQQPIMRGYRMECCDCGLVHEMEFRAFVVTKDNGETFEYVNLPDAVRVEFRVARDSRATAKARKARDA